LNGEDLLLFILNRNQLKEKKILSANFKTWTFEDLLLDLYKFQSADELAKKDIPKERLQQYEVLEKLYQENQSQELFIVQLKSLFKILNYFQTEILQIILKSI
jgi:hypothetical protein